MNRRRHSLSSGCDHRGGVLPIFRPHRSTTGGPVVAGSASGAGASTIEERYAARTLVERMWIFDMARSAPSRRRNSGTGRALTQIMTRFAATGCQ